MKKTLGLLIGLIAVMTVLAACNTQNLQTIGTDPYYVQVIDGGKEIETSYESRYEYQLKGFDEEGHPQMLLFTANHQLAEGAYLTVYYKAKKEEVIYYEEVEEADVPEKALKALQ